MQIKKQHCQICKKPFQPHSRHAKKRKIWTQKTCGERKCRTMWRRRRWQCWAKLNPHLIKNEGRRAKIRAWAKAYPNYWQSYRANHAQYTISDNLRRIAARRRARLSAKQSAIQRVIVDKLYVLEAFKSGKVSAKQTPIVRRVDALEDCLRSTVEAIWSAKQRPIDFNPSSRG